MTFGELKNIIYGGTTVTLYDNIVNSISCSDDNIIRKYDNIFTVPSKYEPLEVAYIETTCNGNLIIFINGGLDL